MHPTLKSWILISSFFPLLLYRVCAVHFEAAPEWELPQHHPRNCWLHLNFETMISPSWC